MLIKTVAQIWVQPDKHEDALPLLKELAQKSAAEDGCAEYRLFLDMEDKNHYVIVEEWESPDKLEAHRATEHFTRIMPLLTAFVSKPPVITRTTPV